FRGFTVNLGVVTRRNFGIVATKPNPAYRKAGVAPPLRDPGFLQQRQRSAPGADENELGLNVPILSALFVSDPHAPHITITAQILHPTVKVNCESLFLA